MANSNDRSTGSNGSNGSTGSSGSNGSNAHKPRTSGGIRFAGRRLRDIEREAVERTLELNGYNQSAAARSLCISRPTLARKLNSYRASDGKGSGHDEPCESNVRHRSNNDRERSSHDEQRSNNEQERTR